MTPCSIIQKLEKAPTLFLQFSADGLGLETLGQFRFALTARAEQINKISEHSYHDEMEHGGDTKTAMIFIEIESYFNRNPIDLGTNALADLRSIENKDRTPIRSPFGTTIYHDDWEWAQQRLIKSEKNIAKIVEKINAKPL